jgi:hypothetical protein
MSAVNKDVKADAAFGLYLLRNVGRFTPPPVHRHRQMTPEQKIAIKQAQIRQLEREIERRASPEEVEKEKIDIDVRLQQEYADKIERLQNGMRMVFDFTGTTEMQFMISTMGMAVANLE